MEAKILLIIPAYNEEENILRTVQEIKRYNLENHTNFHIIVINDGSSDGTERVLLENDIPHIQLIHNLGIGGAVQTGYKYAFMNEYDIAIQYDGDGQHDVSYVKDLIKPLLLKQANMTIGSRFVKGSTSQFKSTKARQLGIKIISAFINFFTRKKVYDVTSGFRAIDRSLIEQFSKNYPLEYPEPISTTQILKQNYQVIEVPVSMNERIGGVSSIRSWKNAYYMINVLLSIVIIGSERRK